MAVPADVQGLFVLPSVESEQQKNYVSHAIDLTAGMIGSGAGNGWLAPRVARVSKGRRSWPCLAAALMVVLFLVGCGPASTTSDVLELRKPSGGSCHGHGDAVAQPGAADVMATAGPSAPPERPEWFDLEMTDVLTGRPFTINDFAGKVVLLETMAVWCPTCRQQGDEVLRLHELPRGSDRPGVHQPRHRSWRRTPRC